jgi:CheY-like chemotaxis protein
MRRALSLLLESWGVAVIEAGDTPTALALLQESGTPRPDALLADYQLDDGATGIQAIQAVRRRTGRLPSRIVTASRTPEVQREARRIGVEVLHKPFDPLMLHLFLGSVKLGRST